MKNTDMAIAVLVEEMGDRCLMGRNRRSGFVDDEGAIAVLCGEIGDRVLGDEGRSVIIMINQVSYIDCYD